MCANNEAIVTAEDVDDLMQSHSTLRPCTAWAGSCWAPVWHAGVDLTRVDGYVVEIVVSKVDRRLRFPTCRIKGADGRCNWTNDLVGQTVVVDKWTLEEMVKHQGVEFSVVRGYYYDEGRNYTIGKVIQELYSLRAKYKKEENPIEQIYKLIMNSAYGKTGLRPIDCDVSYQPEKDAFIDTNYNHIKSYTQMPNGQWRFEIYKEIHSHYNRQQCAMEILSVSKKIMNEVMVLAEDLSVDIHYQDTDSMHVPSKDTPRLIEAFRKKFGRNLIGEQLGQFDTDFEFKDAWHLSDGRYQKVGKGGQKNVRAVRSVFLGKKSYLDVLQDDAGNIAYHIRMKSIPSKCLLDHVAKCYDDPLHFYLHLYNGNPATIDLKTAGNCCFRTARTTSCARSTPLRARCTFPSRWSCEEISVCVWGKKFTIG